MTEADRFLRQMGIPRYDELVDDEAPAVETSPEASIATPADSAIPPALAAKPNTADSPLDNLTQLQREAAQLQNLFSVEDPGTSYEGRDSSGSIVVNVDSDGRVSDVRVASSWRDSIDAHGLGAAVLEAVSAATTQRVAAWSTSVAEHGREAPEGSEPPPEPSPSHSAQPPASPDNQQARKALQNVLSLIEGVEGALDNLEERADQGSQRVVGHGPENSVKVTVAGANQVVDVEIARRFAERAPGTRIAHELVGAFEAAYERATAVHAESLHGDGPLARIQALSSDPANLLNYLGLNDGGRPG